MTAPRRRPAFVLLLVALSLLAARIEARLAAEPRLPAVDVLALRERAEREGLPPAEIETLRRRMRREVDLGRIRRELFLDYAAEAVRAAEAAPTAAAAERLGAVLDAFGSPELLAGLMAGMRIEEAVAIELAEQTLAAATVYGLALREHLRTRGALPADIADARPEGVPPVVGAHAWRIGTNRVTGGKSLFLAPEDGPLFHLDADR